MGQTLVCVRSSANEDPAKDFNEWMQHVYKEIRKNYNNKLYNKNNSDELQSNL
jgi:hypothetical protein